MIAPTHPLFVDVDLVETRRDDLSVRQALVLLRQLYAEIDQRQSAVRAEPSLPCNLDGQVVRIGAATKPCADCCHESVFLTPLEWLNVVEFMQREFDPTTYASVIREGHRLYDTHATAIEQLPAMPEGDERLAMLRALRFTCPLLGASGCLVYPERELLGRLFGHAFNAQSGIYGCARSGKYFADEQRSLLVAERCSQQLAALPLTGFRQVYPYYFHHFFERAAVG